MKKSLHVPLLVFASVVLGVVLVSIPSAYAACNAQLMGKTVFGQSGSAVKALQECLIGAGYSIPAGATGYYGAQTKTAVQAFYRLALSLPTWDGLSVGPVGRAKLAVSQQGGYTSGPTTVGYKKARDAEELRSYVKESQQGYGVDMMRGVSVPSVPLATVDADESFGAPLNIAPERVSGTNVQVAGIDEPDIVKTDGTTLYYSRESRWYGIMFAESSMPIACVPDSDGRCIMPPSPQPEENGVTAITAFPLEQLGIASESIKERGEMLLAEGGKTLIVLAQPKIVAYNVSDPKKPVRAWELSLENNTSLVTARLKGSTMYLVTQSYLAYDKPCPIIPLMRGTTNISIPCTDVWVPNALQPVDTTYTVLSVNPANGSVQNTVALAAPSGNTVVSLFANNVYIVTHSYAQQYKIMAEIALDAAKPHLTQTAYEKAQRILGYDISASGKMNEVSQVIESDLARLSQNDRLRAYTEMENTLRTLMSARLRDIDRSTIARISLASLTLAATGEVPGSPLNQFALDEYNGDLRIAVTVDEGWGGAESVNDVYVLGSDLKEKGSIRDLGLGERVYSARFMGDTAYLVTFRQIDPFYVLDLSIPTAPKKVGELKIPGYSAYLEPLGNDLVLGVGRDGGNVKLSVFDVRNPEKPLEKAVYILKEGWTEVEGNHHAFLRDAKHSAFFLPGGSGGYVFTYGNGTLSLKATVAGYSVKRAIYINDYLYVIGEDKITVLDENTWKEVKTLSL